MAYANDSAIAPADHATAEAYRRVIAAFADALPEKRLQKALVRLRWEAGCAMADNVVPLHGPFSSGVSRRVYGERLAETLDILQGVYE